MPLHEDFSKLVDIVHRDNTAIWFIGSRVLVAVGGMWHGTLEAAGWKVGLDAGVGSVIHEADRDDPNFPKMWQALCRAEGNIPRDAVQVEDGEE